VKGETGRCPHCKAPVLGGERPRLAEGLPAAAQTSIEGVSDRKGDGLYNASVGFVLKAQRNRPSRGTRGRLGSVNLDGHSRPELVLAEEDRHVEIVLFSTPVSLFVLQLERQQNN
jgi:hypothetical protein